MGIAPYKTFTFDGVSSSTYGVYLTGEGVYNAPERAVEMIEVPGRNGTFALDQGRFQNISVTYRIGMFDDSESNFATKVANFRNWLCSKVGYVRLSDDYNPNEYRMAVYMNGLELDHDFLIAGEAEITFECKPQRWLTSGETETAVANNGTLSNPTLFDSEPLLAVKGYGNIAFNGYSIDIENVTLGNVLLLNGWQGQGTKTMDDALLNNGDTFVVKPTGRLTIGASPNHTSGATVTSTTNCSAEVSKPDSRRTIIYLYGNDITFTKGTASTVTYSANANISIDGTSYTRTITATVVYDGALDLQLTFPTMSSITNVGIGSTAYCDDVFGESTVSALGNPTYIDCEIGECYYISGSDVVSLNGVIALGSDLPTLAPGTNTFTYDNTVTELKVTPRWWKV